MSPLPPDDVARLPATVAGVIGEVQEARMAARAVANSDDAGHDLESLGAAVESLADAVDGLARMVGAVLVNEAALRASVKRLPSWAARQAPEARQWLAQLPQEVLDSEFLERVYHTMAVAGMVASDDTLELMRARVAELTAEQGLAATPVEPALPGVATWQGQLDMGPYACPRCGSVGTGRGMGEHLAEAHSGPDERRHEDGDWESVE